VRLKGYVKQSKMVVVADDQMREVFLELPLDQQMVPPGRIKIDTDPTGCSVFIDDEYVGVSPLAPREYREGSHVVRVACENYGERTSTVFVRSGQTEARSFSLEATVFGYLTIRPVPASGSEVRLNGQRVPMPVEFRKVVPGRHIVTVTNSRLNQTKQIQVDVGPNQRITRRVNLVQ
jgi:hypothetical protein